jgi:hypothetical protein
LPPPAAARSWPNSSTEGSPPPRPPLLSPAEEPTEFADSAEKLVLRFFRATFLSLLSPPLPPPLPPAVEEGRDEGSAVEEPGESETEDVPERALMSIFFGADVFFLTVARFLMQRLSISLSNLASSKKLYLSSSPHRTHGTHGTRYNVRKRSMLEI